MLSPSFLLKKTNITTGKSLLFYLTCTIWVLGYTLLTFSVSLILAEKLSVFYVGLFMSITHFIAIFADIPLGFIQKIIPSRWLLFISVAGLLTTTFIFLGGQSAILTTFAAVLLYGLAHDVYDITMLSYIFQNSHPEAYSQNISQKNVAEALGVLVGLGLTSVFGILQHLFDPLWVTLLFLLVTAIFILLFFNKAEYDVQLSELDTKVMLNQFAPEELLKDIKSFLVSTKNVAIDKIEEIKNTIILKPIRPLQKFEKESFSKELKEAFQGIFSMIVPPKLPLIWSGTVIAFFSFWDTFIITFQPIYISKQVVAAAGLSQGLTGVVIALFIIPLFVCQVPFAKFADKLGRPLFMYIGLAISSVSIFGFSISNDVFWTILMGLANSVGYAAAFPAGQALFAQRFQENYAVLHNSNTFDANVSAGPLKMLINFGNVFGTFIGGVLIAMFDFKLTFIVLGAFLAMIFILSLIAVAWVTKPIMKPRITPTAETTIAEMPQQNS